MSIITTGINIVATGVNQSINQMQRFGKAFNDTHKQAQTFANGYNNMGKQVTKSSNTLSKALNANWDAQYRSAKKNVKNQERELRRLSSMYDRTFREIGNRYQSMVMGSVALSMSGIGLQQIGSSMLGATKTALDQAREFEVVMSQIQFYGRRTAEEMKTINKEIFQLGFDLPVKTSEIANSVLSAQKLGYDDVEEAIKMGKEASKIQFMSIGKLDGEESLKYINQLRKLTGYAIDDVDKLTDKLVKTADVSAASVDTLWKTIQSSRTAYDSLGGDEDTFLTLTGVMADRLMPRQAGMALNSFAGGVQMAEKAGRENRGTRGKYYNQLLGAIGGNFDSYQGDILKYIQDVADKSVEIWGEGSERAGNLQSIFGKSALDLFYAVDAYTGQTGRSMVQMREEIQNADGHAQKLMDTLMNGSYGTERRLEAIVEQFQILYGTAIRPAFNMILDGLTKIIGKVNQFMQAHPKLTKALGYGVGIAGALLVATGSIMLAVGGFLALYASIGNVITQIARNTRVLDMLGQGYNSAGAMIKGKMLGPLNMLRWQLLKVSAVTFFLWLAWKNDFLRIRTSFNEWREDISKGLKKSQAMFEMYAEGSASALNLMFAQNKKNGGLDAWIANTWTKTRMLWDGIKDIWGDGIISVEKHQMLSDAGLLGIVEKVYEIKTAAIDFWNGFQDGMKDGIDLLKDILGPLLDVWDWVSEKVLKIFQHFGYFENVNKGIGSKWEQWGQKAGYLVGSVIAIRVGLWGWLKAFKLILSPFKLMHKMTKGIFGMFTKLKNFKFGKLAGGMARMLFPAPIRRMANTGRYAMARRFGGSARQGAHSRLPYARQTIDPTTGRPNGQVTYQRRWWQRNNKGSTVIPSRDGRTSSTIKSRGFGGRMADMWLGRAYVPDQRVDKRGRTYNQIQTKHGASRTTADGRVNGRQVRTGGLKGRLGRLGGVLGNQRGAVGGGKGFAFGNLFKGMGKGIGHLAGGLGKGLLKGFGKVLLKGIPFIFKTALRAIPFLGWALLAWDAISLIWGNWDWIKNAGAKAWEWIKGVGVATWDWIKEKASGVWTGIGILAQGVWDWIKGLGVAVWDGILAYSSTIWNGIKSLASGVWNSITGFASGMWTAMRLFAVSAWNRVTGIASGVISTVKGYVNGIFDGLFNSAKTAWNNIKQWFKDNPITQAVKAVGEAVSGDGKRSGKGARTGEWYVPKDNMPYNLHQGEMVLKRREAQIMRSLVGSDDNSISDFLLGNNDVASGNISVAQPQKKILRPKVNASEPVAQTETKGGDTTIEVTFAQGAIVVANATASEMKKGAKQMFEEFKRMVELDNMKHYKPARPRTR